MMAGEAAAESSGSGSTYPVKEAGQKVESGEEAISQDRAMQIVREMFPDLLEGKDLDIQLQDDYRGDSSGIWHLNWNNPTPGGRRVEHISISIDADSGALVNLYYYDSNVGAEGGVTPLTEEAAKQKAMEYARKYRPAEFGRTRLAENDYYGYYPSGMIKNAYNFYWERIENGVPVEWDGISVGVDLFSGRLASFSVNWHKDAVFPQPGTMPEDLEQKVLSELGLILCYQVPEGVKTNLPGVPEANLVYRLNSPGMLKISPDSGEVLTADGKTIPLIQYKRFSGLPVPATGGSLEGTGPVNRPVQKISQAEAQKAAREFFRKIGMDGEVDRRGSGSSGGGVFYDEYWSYGLADEENWKPREQRKQIDVGIDVFTGEVRNYNAFNDYAGCGRDDSSKQKITRKVARDKAVDFIRLVSPEKLGQVAEERQDESYTKFGEGYTFNFVRLVNGIPFLRDGIMISVGAGGEITSYDCNWHAVKFPSAAGLTTREEAEKVFQEKMRLKPAYFFPLEGEDPRPGKKPVLALMFDSRRDMGIDAHTGQLVALDIMAAQPEEKTGAVVPQEHWAAASLAVLADSGLLPDEGFDPDGPVSRRDAVRVLMSAMQGNYRYNQYQQVGEKASFTDVSPDDRDYAVIQYAVRRGMLVKSDRFFPEQPLLREELAVWLVRALGYSEVAEMPAVIGLKAADASQVSDKARNYVAIAWGLDLIKGNENNLFRPADQVTWAELASLVTRAVPRLRSVQQW
ncbi:MAG: hypothetical protein GX425_06285 [Peptococcaceae bacterium]|nr:hypothetical protein [Peptococcaceae bacterium]